jgi:hypothetical protein
MEGYMNLEQSAREIHEAGISLKDAAALVQWSIDHKELASSTDLEKVGAAIDDIEAALASLREALAKIDEE